MSSHTSQDKGNLKSATRPNGPVLANMTIDSLLIVVFLILALHATTSNSTSNPDDIVRISLHAQAPPSDSLIVGSILTTSGISSSLATPALSAKAVHVRTYYPFHYESANTDCFDLMIIEGYFMMISAFIHEARSWNRNNCPNGNELKIVYWSLDPDFPPPSTVISLDIGEGTYYAHTTPGVEIEVF